jgi:ATP synthase protein I
MNPSNKQPPEKDRSSGSGGLGDNPWRAAGLVGTIGVNLAACLGIGYWLGSKADALQHTSHWSITGLVAGLVVGIVTTIFLIRAFTGGNTK